MLAERRDFKHCRLSSYLVDQWNAQHNIPCTRTDLQLLGNRIREEASRPGVLVENSLNLIESDGNQHSSIVFDGIRSLGEIEVLRERFEQGSFCLALNVQPSNDGIDWSIDISTSAAREPTF
jgi:hypothetical protein